MFLTQFCVMVHSVLFHYFYTILNVFVTNFAWWFLRFCSATFYTNLECFYTNFAWWFRQFCSAPFYIPLNILRQTFFVTVASLPLLFTLSWMLLTKFCLKPQQHIQFIIIQIIHLKSANQSAKTSHTVYTKFKWNNTHKFEFRQNLHTKPVQIIPNL